MKKFGSYLLLAVFSVAPSLGHGQSGNAAVITVTISIEDQSKMGVETIALDEQSIADAAPAYVSAIDIGPLLSLESDRAAASAAYDASRRELARLSKLASLDQSASAQSVEAARALAAADKAKLDLLDHRLRLEWSPALAALIDTPKQISALSQGELTLVRADAPSRPNGLIGEVAIAAGGDAPPVLAEPIGLSGVVDLRMQTIGLYALVRGADAALIRPGRVFDGEIRTDKQATGVVIPRSAIVRIDGASWVYVQTANDLFERRKIVDARRIKDGWFVATDFKAGDKIAVAGAEGLIAVERADESAEAD